MMNVFILSSLITISVLSGFILLAVFITAWLMLLVVELLTKKRNSGGY